MQILVQHCQSFQLSEEDKGKIALNIFERSRVTFYLSVELNLAMGKVRKKKRLQSRINHSFNVALNLLFIINAVRLTQMRKKIKILSLYLSLSSLLKMSM